MRQKEAAMIELTQDQAQAVETYGKEPPLVIDPRTRETFVLVRKDAYDAMQKWMASLKRRWDNPADNDLTRKPK
jgi:hypothetical protein